MGRSHWRHAHSDRFVYNSKCQAHSIEKLCNLDKNALQQEFKNTLAFSNFKSDKSYAQVVQTKNSRNQKVQQVHTGKNNTKLCDKVVGLNPLAKPFVSAKVNKQAEVVLSKCTDINTPVPRTSTTPDLCPVVGLPLSNRFQV